MIYDRSIFSGIPKEYWINPSTDIVFVSDFFVKDVEGGAELTSEAIIKASPKKVAKIHSASVTKEMLDKHVDKYWIFGNFTTLPEGIIEYLPSSKTKYSIIEYDFKFCAFRSTNRHQQQTGEKCNCPATPHGLDIARMFRKADRIFWMSEGQKNIWVAAVPEISNHPGHRILSSVFDKESIEFLRKLRNHEILRSNKWAILGSGSWIKGIEETQKWCTLKKRDYVAIPKLPYSDFLYELNKHQGFIFMPLDKDTCPRVTIEAKLLGLNLELNENVLNKRDPWFTGTVEECEAYLLTRASWFWEQLP